MKISTTWCAADLSTCGKYRYSLTRIWGDPDSQNLMVFCMLNPSTADANTDDPTIRRCMGFARREGCDGIHVVNIYALRATSPANMLADPNRVDAVNLCYLRQAADCYGSICCAWGNHAEPVPVRRALQAFESRQVHMSCLGKNKSGAPKHPLYLAANAEMVSYP